jgi:hypothetical protein
LRYKYPKANTLQGFYHKLTDHQLSETLSPGLFRPIWPKPLEVIGNFQMMFTSEINSDKVLLIHLLPEGETAAGSIPRLLQEFLLPFLDDNVYLYEISYCLSDRNSSLAHIHKLAEVVESLE